MRSKSPSLTRFSSALLFLLFSFGPASNAARAGQVSETESIIVGSFGSPSEPLAATQVYQYGSQLWVISGVTNNGPNDGQAMSFALVYQYDSIEAFAPAIAAEPVFVESDRYQSISPLLANGATLLSAKPFAVLKRFDYGAGDGWTHNAWLGDFNLRNYPWIYSPAYGWLYVVCSTPSLDNRSDNNGTYTYRAIENAYWFFSPTNGWLWAHQTAWPQVYSVSQDKFVVMPMP